MDAGGDACFLALFRIEENALIAIRADISQSPASLLIIEGFPGIERGLVIVAFILVRGIYEGWGLVVYDVVGAHVQEPTIDKSRALTARHVNHDALCVRAQVFMVEMLIQANGPPIFDVEGIIQRIVEGRWPREFSANRNLRHPDGSRAGRLQGDQLDIALGRRDNDLFVRLDPAQQFLVESIHMQGKAWASTHNIKVISIIIFLIPERRFTPPI